MQMVTEESVRTNLAVSRPTFEEISTLISVQLSKFGRTSGFGVTRHERRSYGSGARKAARSIWRRTQVSVDACVGARGRKESCNSKSVEGLIQRW